MNIKEFKELKNGEKRYTGRQLIRKKKQTANYVII